MDFELTQEDIDAGIIAYDEEGFPIYDWEDEYDDSMDGDFDTGMRDAGWGTDEDYGYYGENEDW